MIRWIQGRPREARRAVPRGPQLRRRLRRLRTTSTDRAIQRTEALEKTHDRRCRCAKVTMLLARLSGPCRSRQPTPSALVWTLRGAGPSRGASRQQRRARRVSCRRPRRRRAATRRRRQRHTPCRALPPRSVAGRARGTFSLRWERFRQRRRSLPQRRSAPPRAHQRSSRPTRRTSARPPPSTRWHPRHQPAPPRGASSRPRRSPRTKTGCSPASRTPQAPALPGRTTRGPTAPRI